MKSQTLPAARAESRHNLKYWRRQPYLGFGLDAHSMVAHPAWLRAALQHHRGAGRIPAAATEACEDVRQLSSSEELEEAWFLGLRLREGVAWQALAAEFGRDRVEIFLPVVRELCELELLTDEEGVVRLTRRGVLFSNEVFARFLGVEKSSSMSGRTVYRPCPTTPGIDAHRPAQRHRHPSHACHAGRHGCGRGRR